MNTMLEEYKGVWALAEVRDGKIHPVSYELLAWGRSLADKLGVELSGVILGHNITDQAEQLIARGADRAYVVDSPELQFFNVESFAKVLCALAEELKPEVFLAAATTAGCTVMPVIAARLHTGLTADCTGLDIDEAEGLLIQTRPAIGGNVLATIKTPNHRPQMATVRPRSKQPLAADAGRRGEVIRKEVPPELLTSRITRLAFCREATVGKPLQDADVIVAGGSGMRDRKNCGRLEGIAARLGGSVGATCSAVDMGWLPYSRQVGLSGKTVSPRLYMAFGISGAAQHMAGMFSSEVVVAVNSDRDAPIFRVADFGIVGDLFEVISELDKKLENNNGMRA
jgi:electron transfer flavoprotein alpha subunit